MSIDKHELYRSLSVVMDDAQRKADDHQGKIGDTPLHGWSQKKHDDYHTKYMRQAMETVSYCFVRQMQLSPD